MMRDVIIIILVCSCAAMAINKEVKVKARRAQSSRITPRHSRRQEWAQ